jgi:hypothetical protein
VCVDRAIRQPKIGTALGSDTARKAMGPDI